MSSPSINRLYIFVEDHIPKQITQALAIDLYSKLLDRPPEEQKEYAIWAMIESGPGEYCMGEGKTLFVV